MEACLPTGKGSTWRTQALISTGRFLLIALFVVAQMQIAVSACRADESDKGVDYWTGVIARQPKDGSAYFERAASWGKLQEIEKSIADLDVAILLEPKNAKFHAARAEALLFSNNRPDAALVDINKAMELESGNSDLRFMRTLILAAQQRREEAAAEANKLVELNPADEAAQMFKAALSMAAAFNNRASGEAAVKAIDDYRAIAKDPDADRILLMRAATLHQQKKFAEAITDYTSFIERCPDEKDIPLIYDLRAGAHRLAGQFGLALDDYSTSIRLAPAMYIAYAHKAWVLATCSDDKVRDGKLAVELATRACELNDWKPYVQQVLAAAYAECGQFDEAVERQTKALEALENPPAAKPTDATAKKRRTFTIQLSPIPFDPQAKSKANHEEAAARLESYLLEKPLRE